MFEEKYKDKRIVVWTKKNMKFEGQFLSENDFGFWIDDRKIGKKFIAFSEIGEINEVSE